MKRYQYEQIERKKLDKMQKSLLYKKNHQLMDEKRTRKKFEERNHLDLEKHLLDKELQKVDLNAVRNMNSRNMALSCAIDNLNYEKLRNEELRNWQPNITVNNTSGDMFDSIPVWGQVLILYNNTFFRYQFL